MLDGREVKQFHLHLVTILFSKAAILLVTAHQKCMCSGDELDVVMPGDEAVERS